MLPINLNKQDNFSPSVQLHVLDQIGNSGKKTYLFPSS